jgi:predicted nuclease of predicted toxin-antitoxin system
VKLYLDESVSVVLAAVLREHGIDCMTARDAGNLGLPDERQLAYSTSQGRIIFTHDTRDFLALAVEWQQAERVHSGMLLSHQVPLRELIARFRTFLFLHGSADLTNQVLWLPPAGQ